MTRLLLICIFLSAQIGMAQNLSGVVNTYYQVVNINLSQATITVSNSSGISPNDSLIIIQMKGAIIDNTPDPSSNGNVFDYNNAGNFELVEVCAVNGNEVVLKKMLKNQYSAAGQIQLVGFNTTQNAIITGQVTCATWDGNVGGVVVIYDLGSLTFNDDIDVSGNGFRGGSHDESTYSCNFLSDNSNFDYDVSTGLGAMKGEGIANYGSMTGGRGPLANGGGGGNDHNSGGGGGSNCSSAGVGGENDDPGTFNCKGFYPGIGGRALSSNNIRLFSGGGGGAGHSNSSFPSDGANGGGIVIVVADMIQGNGNSILAFGNDAVDAHGDGAGGGGGGGSVLLLTNTISGGLTVDLHGGDGGDMDASAASNTNRCFGPGGGGSGGLLRVGPGVIAGYTTVLSPGQPGIVVSSTAGCNGTSVNATAGNQGIEEGNGAIPESGKCNNSCNLVTNVDLGPDQNICEGDIIILDGGNPGLPHMWSTGETTETISVSTGGFYKVEIDGGYCIACDSIDIFSSPGLTRPTDTTFNQCESNTIILDAGNPGSTYNWSSGETSQQLNVSSSGSYNVTISNGNCSIDVNFEVFSCLFIPNTITPNSDGSNDFWEIDGLGDYPDHTVSIYNRRNQIVFETTDYNNSFDGSGLPAGVYYYRLDLGQAFEPIVGSLTIVR